MDIRSTLTELCEAFNAHDLDRLLRSGKTSPPRWPAQTLLYETDPWIWLRRGEDIQLFAQTAFQQGGHATTLLVACDARCGPPDRVTAAVLGH